MRKTSKGSGGIKDGALEAGSRTCLLQGHTRISSTEAGVRAPHSWRPSPGQCCQSVRMEGRKGREGGMRGCNRACMLGNRAETRAEERLCFKQAAQQLVLSVLESTSTRPISPTVWLPVLL
eukprot:1158335-Pelagomonas_calceolata.AAC.5